MTLLIFLQAILIPAYFCMKHLTLIKVRTADPTLLLHNISVNWSLILLQKVWLQPSDGWVANTGAGWAGNNSSLVGHEMRLEGCTQGVGVLLQLRGLQWGMFPPGESQEMTPRKLGSHRGLCPWMPYLWCSGHQTSAAGANMDSMNNYKFLNSGHLITKGLLLYGSLRLCSHCLNIPLCYK